MNISEFNKPAKDKVAKISEALETMYGFKVYDTQDIKKLYDVKKSLKQKIKELEATLPFNTYSANPKYMQALLLKEAVDNMIQTHEAKAKPDFLDMDKDGDKKEPMKKAVKDKKVKEEVAETEESKDEEAKEEKATNIVEEKMIEIKKLLEQEVEKAEIVIAAKSIVDELQNMIEDLGKLQNDELGAIVDQMSYQYGGDAAANFNTAVASQLETLLGSIKSAKEAVNNEVLVLTGEAPAQSDMSATDSDLGDMGSDIEDPVDDLPADDLTGGDDAASGPVDEPLGRAKKA
tara:strand:+ start:2496 stop:3365 length:870 start_codon:yes stop_codon:yes gene_type:complete